ncbi:MULTISPECIES: GNAT family protein [unclassified Roseitalea]|uniref:GNAT family N-acetyltransferase n=1 Tax=unclassified Roseitalea TaxID=2639107 RepID=UPI00273EEDFC|nr:MULTISPECIES: GNAT family protein [unclassified Roseitalea]
MFAFSNRSTGKAVMEGRQVHLRHPELADHEQWAALRAQSATFLKPWEPVWPRNDLTRPAFRARLRRYNNEIRAGTGYPFLVCRNGDDVILGGITLGNIRRGVAQNGQIGYWIGARFAGQGYMTEAVALICEFAFARNGLHRLEAACIPGNNRSIRLLERNGFHREGILAAYLKINGAWRDHVLYARINPLHVSAAASDGTER